MRRPLVLIILPLVACGTRSPSADTAPDPPGLVIESPNTTDFRLAADDRTVTQVLPIPLANAWESVTRVYRGLGIPIRSEDRAAAAVASAPFAAPRRLLNRPLSAFVDCGQTMTGPRVDLWAVTIELVTSLAAAEGGTRIATRMSASARPRDGSSVEPVRCTSTGILEREIARMAAVGEP